MKALLFRWTCMVAMALSVSAAHGQLMQRQSSPPPKQAHVPCYSDELMQERLQNDPSLQDRIRERDRLINFYIDQKHHNDGQSNEKSLNASLIIPVVVYVVHQNGPENITDLQVTSQIDALNAYYEDYGIQFCLATKKGSQNLTTISTPSGITSSTPGIFHYYNPTLTNHNVSQQTTLMATGSTLPSDQYLKIWVVKGIASNTLPPGQKILGYATFPEFATPSTDGIVMSYDAFGDVATCSCSTLQPYSQLGRTLVHEAGHYLGLYHTFQGGCQGMTASNCATSGDKVCDTPPVNAPNTGCPVSTWNTCSESPDLPDDIHNYMDYVDESCMQGFTDGQNDRMLAQINMFRSNLIASSNLIYTGINCTGGLYSDFTASNYGPCVNTAVNFTALTSPGATYTWDFGDGSTGTGATISHTYTGVYQPASVVLTVSDGVNTVSSTHLIFVDSCQPVNPDQGHWYFGQRGGLDFSLGSPVYDNNAYTHGNSFDEACAVQSDAAGNLLFYTNGVQVWNSNHTLINAGNLLNSDLSAHRGAIIVPNPANASQYYIFTQDGGSYNSAMTYTLPGADGFRYSIVQITGGMATTTPTWNVPITPPSYLGYSLGTGNAMQGTEGIAAVKSCNGYWIITGGKKGTQTYITIFSLTPGGLSFFSETLSPFNTMQQSFEISRDGTRLAVGSGTNGSLETAGLAAYNFNIYTGAISGQIILNNNLTYGTSFSPDSKLLYSTSWSTNNLLQYDLTDPSPATSGRVVGTSSAYASEMQMGPDDKLYLSSWTTNVQVVHQPNNRSTIPNPNACLFTTTGPVMQTTLTYSMPNLIDATQNSVYSNTITVNQLSCLQYQFGNQLCANSFSWNFGDPASGAANTSTLQNPTHTFSAPGTYTITVTGGGTTLSTTVQIGTSSTIDGAPTVCLSTSNLGNYSTNLQPGQTAHWTISGGGIVGLDNQPDVMVAWTSLPGTVTLTVTDTETGCTSTSTVTITESCANCVCELSPSFVYSVNNNNCTVTFSAQHGGPSCLQNVTYTWNIDGNILTGNNVSYTYSGSGAHTVCLTVTANGNGQTCSQDICQTIETNCATPCDCKLDPMFDYSFDEAACLFTFYGISGAPSCQQNVEYQWNFGDGTTATGQFPNHVFPGPGTYKVCLLVIVRNSKGDIICQKEFCKDVYVNCESGPCDCSLSPVIEYSFYPENCLYTFHGFSGGPECLQNVAYYWDFGDGTTATGQHPNHVFPGPGTYKVCVHVVVYNAAGEIICDKERCIEVYVDCTAEPCDCKLSPAIEYEFFPEECLYSFHGFSGGPECLQNVEYYWNFDDGTTAVGQHPNHVFPGPGSYKVCVLVVVRDAAGNILCEKKRCIEVYVDCTPEPCECKLSPVIEYEFFAEQCLYSFHGFSGGPECLQNVQYQWSFGDGTPIVTGQHPNHVFPGPGTYKVCVLVTVHDAAGNIICEKKRCIEVNVDCTPEPCECDLHPVFDYSLNQASCVYTFYGFSGGPSCIQNEEYHWDFGDGTTGSGQNPTHSYSAAGTYKVCLLVIVRNSKGDIICEKKFCKEINVQCESKCECKLKPMYDYSFDEEACRYTFYGVSGDPECQQEVEFHWNFGDGTTGTGQMPEHIFTNAGTYNVCLTVIVRNSKGDIICEETYCKYIEVKCKGDCVCSLKPEFDYTLDPKNCVYTFYGISGGPNCLQYVEYFWNFGDGTSSMGQTPGHVYTSDGAYQVCLEVVVRNDKGDILCKDKYCRMIEVTCKGDCSCDLAPTYTTTQTGSCEFLFTGNSGSSCVNIDEIKWFVNGQQLWNGPVFSYHFDVNQGYSVCMVVYGSTPDGEKCEKEYCQEFFYTDCYPFGFAPEGGVKSAPVSNQSLQLFPNPANDRFQLKFAESPEGSVEVTLRTMDGKVVGNSVYTRLEGSDELTISLPESLSSGFIVVEVKSGNKVYKEKLMVLKK
jgi:PKD repeat protein